MCLKIKKLKKKNQKKNMKKKKIEKKNSNILFLFLTVLKVRCPGRKMSGFRTVRILKNSPGFQTGPNVWLSPTHSAIIGLILHAFKYRLRFY